MSDLFVVDAGLLTTIQDLGRFGHQRVGVPPSGPMDRAAFVIANRLVGNPDGAAGLECTIKGPRLEVRQAAVVAVTGAPMGFTVNGQEAPAWTAVRRPAGRRPRIPDGERGLPRVPGGGGRHRRPAGAGLPRDLSARPARRPRRPAAPEGRRAAGRDRRAGRGARGPDGSERRDGPPIPPSGSAASSSGPQDDRFTAEGIRAFLEGPYDVTPQADRMGYRLKGPAITHVRGHDIVSDGIPLGGIQVPGERQPIVLLVDRQTTGGYTKIATVIGVDIGAIGQTRPGQRIRFRRVSLEEAHAARVAEARVAGARDRRLSD